MEIAKIVEINWFEVVKSASESEVSFWESGNVEWELVEFG